MGLLTKQRCEGRIKSRAHNIFFRFLSQSRSPESLRRCNRVTETSSTANLSGKSKSRSSPQTPFFKGLTKTLTQAVWSKAPDRILLLVNDHKNEKLRKAQSMFSLKTSTRRPRQRKAKVFARALPGSRHQNTTTTA